MSINYDETLKQFGYNIDSLSKGSHKKVYLNCDYCGELYTKQIKDRNKANKNLDKDACKNCRMKKQQDVMSETHGARNPSQVPEFRKKYNATCLERYDNEEFFASKIGRQKSIEGIKEKYDGVDNVFQHPDIKEKSKAKNRKNLGVDYPMQSKICQEKSEKTMMSKTGYKNAGQVPEFREKGAQTCLERHGDRIATRSPIIKAKIRATAIKNGHWKSHDDKTMRELSDGLDIPYTTFVTRVRQFGFEMAINMPKQETGQETIFEAWLKEQKIDYSVRKMIDGRYYDFLLNDKIVIELDGLYWHSDAVITDNLYHVKKYEHYINNGYHPLFFRENEIYDKFDIVASIVNHKLGRSNKLGARKCRIVEIDAKASKEFFRTNHLMGRGKGVAFGLMYNDELYCAIQVKRLKDKEYEISRFCNKVGWSVIGGFSRMLQHFIKLEKPTSIITFVDRRHGNGNHLIQFGFKLETCFPSFKWVGYAGVFHRTKYRCNTGYDYKLRKIWDCGQAKYLLNIV